MQVFQRTLRRWGVLCLGGALCTCSIVAFSRPAAAQVKAQPISDSATLPFTFDLGAGSMIVPATFAGDSEKGVVYLLVRFGTSLMTISPEMVQRAGLKHNPYEAPSSDGTTHSFDVTQVEGLKIGPLSAQGVALTVSATLADEIQSINAHRPADKKVEGSIGSDLLSDFACLVDFEKQQITLTPKGNLSDAAVKEAGFLGGAASRIPMQEVPGSPKVYTIPGTANGKKISLLLNTDTERTILKAGSLGDLKDIPCIVRGGELAAYSYYRFDSVNVGEVKQSPFYCGVRQEIPRVSGSVLGLDYLSRCRMLIDYPAKRLYLSQISSDLPFPTAASRLSAQLKIAGMAIRPTAAGVWTVNVLDNVNAAYRFGLQSGDVLVSVNGTKANGLSTADLAAALLSDQKIVHLQILRQGKPLALNAPIQSTSANP